MTAAVIEPQAAYRPSPRTPLTLREILTPVFYHRRVVVAAFVAPVLLAALAALFVRPVYVADARLLILLGQDYVFRSDVNGAAQALSFDRAQIVQAEVQILSDRDLRAQAVKDIGLDVVYPGLSRRPHGLEAAAIRLDKDLTIENIPQSNVIEAKLRNQSAVVSAALLNRLIDLYIEHRRRIFQQADPAQVERERDLLRRRLDDIDTAIARYAAAHDFGDYDQAVSAAQSEKASLTSQLQNLEQQYAARSGKASGIGAELNHVPNSISLYVDEARSQQLDGLTSNLLSLQQQRRDAAAKFSDSYPLVVDLDRRIAALEAQIRAAPPRQVANQRSGVNPTHQQLDADLAESQGEKAGLAKSRAEAARELAQADARLKDLTVIGPEYREMARNRALVESAYVEIAKRAEDTRLQDTLSRAQANVKVIQRASPPIEGKAGRAVLILGGIALGVATAAAAVLFASAFSEEMVTPRDAEKKLDLPVILSVSARRRRGGSPTPEGHDAYLTLDDALLVMRLGTGLGAKLGQVVQFIGAEDGAGVSTLALDFALQLAGQGARRVLLIDIEPSEPGGVVRGLQSAGADLIGGPGQRILQLAGTSLSVSRPIATPNVRVDEIQWERVLQNARQNYDVVVLDAPSATRSGAGVVIAPFADTILLVLEAEKTRAAVARSVVERIEAAGGTLAGAIFNKRRFHIPPAIYSRL